MPQFATTATRRALVPFLWIVLAIAIAPACRAQAPHDDLPPLRDLGADRAGTPISVMDLQMLVPPAQLICWSHGASENPQDSHDNGEDSSRLLDSPSDFILTTPTLTPRNEAVRNKEHNSTDQPSAPDRKN
jgi:hypothetical protein